MITAVDSSVLLDVFSTDPAYLAASQDALRQAVQLGSFVVCPVVIAEIRPCFPSREKLVSALDVLGASMTPVSQEAALLVGETWRRYRRAGGRGERLIPDFIIAAHAQTAGDIFLTRDRGFYRRWLKTLKVTEP